MRYQSYDANTQSNSQFGDEIHLQEGDPFMNVIESKSAKAESSWRNKQKYQHARDGFITKIN